MRFIDWFAGIGGFRRGMEMAGHECVGFCEFDRFATASYTAMHLITKEQREYLETLDLKKRQKEILKEEYRNGEWFADDVRTVDPADIPRADCWCFGFPCQDISVAGQQKGLSDGTRSSLFFRIMELLDGLKEEEKPTILFIENVKNLLSVNDGWDFAQVLFALEQRGYDAEWSVLNSKNFGVPQNRERCFIIGHIRGRSSSEVFPVEGADRADRVCGIGHRAGFRRNTQVFSRDGITEALSTCQRGGREHHTIEVVQVGNTNPSGHGMNGNCYYSEGLNPSVTCNKQEGNRVAIPIPQEDIDTNNLYNCRGVVHDANGIARTINASHSGNEPKVAIPVIDPTRGNKTQNGRRFKEDGEESFTLTGQDRHGVAVEVKPVGMKGSDKCLRISESCEESDPNTESESENNMKAGN